MRSLTCTLKICQICMVGSSTIDLVWWVRNSHNLDMLLKIYGLQNRNVTCYYICTWHTSSSSLLLGYELHNHSWFTLVTNDRDHLFLKLLIGWEASGSPNLFKTRSPKLEGTMGEHVKKWLRKRYGNNVESFMSCSYLFVGIVYLVDI